MILLISDFFHKAIQEMNKLNDDFQKLSEINSSKSSIIRKSMQQKSEKFNHLIKERSKHFDFIRNK